jgi:hypothetical protein
VRRAFVLTVAAAALLSATCATAALQPVRRGGPRVRAGTLPLLAPSAGRVTVIVGMPLPPLARAGRALASAAATRRLDAGTAVSRAYLARLARAQVVAIA